MLMDLVGHYVTSQKVTGLIPDRGQGDFSLT